MAEGLSDAAPAHWLRDALDPAGRTVTGFVPADYDGYLRVLNPVTVNSLHRIIDRIPWTAAAGRLGVVVDPWIQWDHVRAATQSPIPDRWGEPECGNLDADLATWKARSTDAVDAEDW